MGHYREEVLIGRELREGICVSPLAGGVNLIFIGTQKWFILYYLRPVFLFLASVIGADFGQLLLDF